MPLNLARPHPWVRPLSGGLLLCLAAGAALAAQAPAAPTPAAPIPAALATVGGETMAGGRAARPVGEQSATAATAPAAPLPSVPAQTVDLDQAIALAMVYNPSYKAAATTVPQSRAEEVTAAIHPNPVLTWDGLFLPLFSPHQWNDTTLDQVSEFDLGVAYTFERGHKRQRRITAARDATTVVRSQLADAARALRFNVAQQFIGVLLAKSTLGFARQDLDSFSHTVNIGEAQYHAGQISEGDFLKIKLQLLQFQTDVSSAQLALVQARQALRDAVGYGALARDFRVIGALEYTPLRGNEDDFQALALADRPDLRAARQGITAAQSQYQLARANGKRDLTGAFTYSHVGGINGAGLTFNMELPFWDRNQGEIARTAAAETQARDLADAAGEQVRTDVGTAFAAAQTGGQVVSLYQSGYLKQAQQSRDISAYAYHRGAASLLDFLDAERSYRATELAYRQALAAYMLALEQLKEATGARTLP